MTGEARIDILGLVIDRTTGAQLCAEIRLTGDGLALFQPGRGDGDPLTRVDLPPETVAAIAGMLRTEIARD